MPTRSAPLVPLAALLCVSACATPEVAKHTDSAAPATAMASAAGSSVAPAIMNIVTTDYHFDAPDTIGAGVVSMRLVNNGKEMHHVQLVRLHEGKTYADMMATMQKMAPGSMPPAWMEVVGGPNAPSGTREQLVTQELTPGAYALICVIPSPDGVPHMMKGMTRALTVVPATGVAATMPTADVNVTMTDYAWEVSTPITTGKHVIRLENAAVQPHEMFIVKLAPGKTAMDYVTWAEKPAGPPPGDAMGGTTAMTKGMPAFVSIDFAPGEYAMICFIPDAKDGKPHFVHGMIKQFKVT